MSFEWRTLPFTDLSVDELYQILQLRQAVFVVEQDCAYLDLDDRDQAAVHMLCLENGELRAYQRCLPPGISYPESALGRIVVDPGLRGQQLGEKLVLKGIEHNLRRWPDRDICINAQAHLQSFYTRLGFQGEGPEYMEDSIPHRKMRLDAKLAAGRLPGRH